MRVKDLDFAWSGLLNDAASRLGGSRHRATNQQPAKQNGAATSSLTLPPRLTIF